MLCADRVRDREIRVHAQRKIRTAILAVTAATATAVVTTTPITVHRVEARVVRTTALTAARVIAIAAATIHQRMNRDRTASDQPHHSITTTAVDPSTSKGKRRIVRASSILPHLRHTPTTACNRAPLNLHSIRCQLHCTQVRSTRDRFHHHHHHSSMRGLNRPSHTSRISVPTGCTNRCLLPPFRWE